MKLDDMLCFAVYSAGHAFNRVYKPLLDRLGLTYPQFLVMICLWNEDAVPVGRIVEQVGLETSTLTPLLKRLEALGHVARRRSERDERQVIVTLTEKGRALRSELGEIARCVFDASSLPLDEFVALNRSLRKLADSLETAGQPA